MELDIISATLLCLAIGASFASLGLQGGGGRRKKHHSATEGKAESELWPIQREARRQVLMDQSSEE